MVEYEVRDEGGTLRLMWNAVENADGYIIFGFGDSLDFTTDTIYDATTPAVFIGPATVIGDDRSYVSYVNSSCSGSLNRRIWNPIDPDSGFFHALYITESGQLVPCSAYGSVFDTLYNFYLTNISGVLWLNNRAAMGETNKLAPCSLTNFHDVKLAAALGPEYQERVEIVDQAIYYIFLDNNSNGYDTTDDVFSKLKIDSIIGNKIYMQSATQRIHGLRWLATINE
jgi:hypothetical protein